MTNTNTPSGNEDLAAAPEYDRLGESGNPFSGDTPTDDHGTKAEQVAGDADQNPPLADWGPTDGEHGVDGDPES